MKIIYQLFSISILVITGCIGPGGRQTQPSTQNQFLSTYDYPADEEDKADNEIIDSAKVIDDLTLEAALQYTQNHPEFVAGMAEVEAAKGRIQQAHLWPNPELNGHIESAPLSGQTFSDAEYIIGIDQQVPLGKRRSFVSDIEVLNHNKLEKELLIRKMEHHKEVKQAFCEVLYWDTMVDIQLEALKIANNGVEVARNRAEAGDIIAVDVSQAEMEYQRIDAELELAKANREQVISTLSLAMGDPEIIVNSVTGDFTHQNIQLSQLTDMLKKISETPYQKVAHLQVVIAEKMVALQKAQRIPDMTIGVGYRRIEEENDDAIDVGVRLPLPLFDNNSGNIHEAIFKLSAAQASAQSNRRKLEAKAQRNYTTLKILLSQAKRLHDIIIPKARDILGTAEKRYQAGDFSLIEVLPLRKNITALRIEYANTLRQLLEAQLELSLLTEG